jgi:hypothetical protein
MLSSMLGENRSVQDLTRAVGRSDLTPGPTPGNGGLPLASAKRQMQMSKQAGNAFQKTDDQPGVTPGGVPQPASNPWGGF